jgi:hypothetical protein
LDFLSHPINAIDLMIIINSIIGNRQLPLRGETLRYIFALFAAPHVPPCRTART